MEMIVYGRDNIPGASHWTIVHARRCTHRWCSTFAPMRPQSYVARPKALPGHVLLGRAVPSLLRGDTVVSMASWAPRHSVRPSATISILRPFECVKRCKVHVAHEHVRGHSSACLPACLRCCALMWEPTLPQHPCLRARCAMMAKHVKLAATSAGAVRQGGR